MAMVLYNHQGRVVDANEAFGAILGNRREDLLGLLARDMWFESSKSKLDDALMWLFTAAAESLSVRCQLISAEGLPVWVDMHMSASTGPEHSEVLAIVQDCTDEMWDSTSTRGPAD